MGGAVSFIPAALTVASALVSKSGSDSSAAGADQAAQGARLAAERTATAKRFEAAQLRVNAGQEIAASQFSAHEQERQGRLVASRQLALAAASGGGASAPTVVSLIARTQKESSLRAAMSIYQGEDHARALRMQAAGREYEASAAIAGGEESAQAYETKAGAYRTAGVAPLLAAGGSLFSKYGMGGVKQGPSGESKVIQDSWLDTGTTYSGDVG